MSELFAWTDGELVRARVTQCALSRVCGACGRSLGRPLVFVGTTEEIDRNALHAPPLHEGCAERVLARQPGGRVVTTSGFEFVRPGRDAEDSRPTFQLNSRLG